MRITPEALLTLILLLIVVAGRESAAQPPASPESAATGNGSSAGQERPADRRDAVRQALQKRVSKTFDGVSVGDAIEWLRHELNLNLFVDAVQIEAHGLSESLASKFNLAVRDVTGRSLLELLLKDHELNWDVCDDVLLICPENGVRRHQWVYDVHELVLYQDFWTTGGAVEDWADYTELLDVITSIIEPSSWESSGPAGVRQLTVAGRAVIAMRSTWHVGEQLQGVLNELHTVVSTEPRKSERAIAFVVPEADESLQDREIRSPERGEESNRLQAALSRRISPRLETTIHPSRNVGRVRDP